MNPLNTDRPWLPPTEEDVQKHIDKTNRANRIANEAANATKAWEESTDTIEPAPKPTSPSFSSDASHPLLSLPVMTPARALYAMEELQKKERPAEVTVNAVSLSVATPVVMIAAPAGTQQAVEAFTKNGIKTLEDMDKSISHLGKTLPASLSEHVSIKEFALAIRSAIAFLRQSLATKDEIENRIQSKTSKIESDQKKTYLLTLGEQFIKYQENREKTKQMGKSKGFHIFLKVFQVLFCLVPPNPVLFVMALMDVIPGKTEGFMAKMTQEITKGLKLDNPNMDPNLKAFVRVAIFAPLVIISPQFGLQGLIFGALHETKLGTDNFNKERRREVEENVALLNDYERGDFGISDISLINELRASKKVKPDEVDILEMIAMLVKLLAKILLGSQTGMIDITAMKKVLNQVKEKNPNSAELKQMEGVLKKLDGIDLDLAGNDQGATPRIKGQLREAMVAFGNYNRARDEGNTADATRSLKILEKKALEIAERAKNNDFFAPLPQIAKQESNLITPHQAA